MHGYYSKYFQCKICDKLVRRGYLSVSCCIIFINVSHVFTCVFINFISLIKEHKRRMHGEKVKCDECDDYTGTRYQVAVSCCIIFINVCHVFTNINFISLI